ncbi:MAG: glycosyltransferase [candidate division Zixibacteria bacterium]|nr:glycosyltransferase [candidate division Zixibacteria bacterium]
MIRIAFIIDTIETPGAGTEKQLLALLHGLDRTRFEPTLVCLRPSRWLADQTFPFAVEILNLGSMIRPGAYGAYRRFKRLHREKQFDIAQTFFLDGNIFGTIAARLAGIRTVVSSRRNIGYWHTGFWKTVLRFLRRFTPYYLANSQAVLEVSRDVEGVPVERITVIYNGLELDDFKAIDASTRLAMRRRWGIEDSQTLVGAVANLRPVKNVMSLILAAEALAGAFPNVRFVVAGEGPLRQELQARIDEAGLTERFQLVGSLTDIPSCLAAFDIGVQCSHSESFSNSLVEYMAAGLPIVASSVGGNVEAIQHGVNGLLYDGTSADGLKKGLEDLLADNQRAQELGDRALKDAFERYSLRSCLDRHEEFYTSIVGRSE